MPEIEIFEIEPGRYGYRVGGVEQEWMPDVEGFVPMTLEQAEACAAVVAVRI